VKYSSSSREDEEETEDSLDTLMPEEVVDSTTELVWLDDALDRIGEGVTELDELDMSVEGGAGSELVGLGDAAGNPGKWGKLGKLGRGKLGSEKLKCGKPVRLTELELTTMLLTIAEAEESEAELGAKLLDAGLLDTRLLEMELLETIEEVGDEL
jgi:hypothetical protein